MLSDNGFITFQIFATSVDFEAMYFSNDTTKFHTAKDCYVGMNFATVEC